jgi:hypothetical protein
LHHIGSARRKTESRTIVCVFNILKRAPTLSAEKVQVSVFRVQIATQRHIEIRLGGPRSIPIAVRHVFVSLPHQQKDIPDP